MLTISQLAAYAGVTVRTVRHYHAKGLLPEPERDHSGYRRYDAAAVVELVRIRTLADAGVPLSRVSQLLDADAVEFAAAVEQIDRRLRAEIRERQRHRERIAQLAAGESLALPPPAVAYVERMRELGFPERLIEVERDSWILIAAQVPDQVSALMEIKHTQLEHPVLRRLYLDIGDLVDAGPDDPRLPALADRVAAFIEAASAEAVEAGRAEEDYSISPDLIELLDTTFLESFACAGRLLELLEERGWTGWTDIRRKEPVH
ncbi:MerR family transcriptional regulator [Intrasporangium flavum]|uniref:MerR family transcriptional regulator n=1 Tax=Intrasporangium flavum TaxID=1428657 RepID=UPI00096F005C|nr:MerR family transcriptional regulator [Intrasporangium flavum]